MRHAIRTQHNAGDVGNRMDFLIWNPDVDPSAVGTLNVMSLNASDTASSGIVHIRPVGTPDVELEVSDGVTTGGGAIVCGGISEPSSRDYKTDIRRLSRQDEEGALIDILALRPARYRYKSVVSGGGFDMSRPSVKGLLYEDAPASVRGAKKTLILSERLANVELALKAAIRKLEGLQMRYEDLRK
jgi:hypothetical protein